MTTTDTTDWSFLAGITFLFIWSYVVPNFGAILESIGLKRAPTVSSNPCHCCGHIGADVTLTGDHLPQSWLCEFCSSTLAGSTVLYVGSYSNDHRFIARLAAELYWKLKGAK
jgi:hypothetical protein